MSVDVLILENDVALTMGAVSNMLECLGLNPYTLSGASSIAKGYNQLAASSKADILCFMHQDTRLDFDTDAIEEYFSNLKNPGVLGFCGSAKQVPGKQWHTCPPLFGGLIQGQGAQARDLNFTKPEFFTSKNKRGFQPVQTLDGYCLFIKRSVFEQIGGFDEAYNGWHGYDMDICAKALFAGFQNYVIDQPSQHFSGGSGGPMLDAALKRFEEKWFMKFSELNQPVRPVARALPATSHSRKGRLKIVVYTIVKNELQFCERFAKSCEDADGVYVLDTGSTDGTPEKLRSLGVNVEVVPFDGWKTLEEYDKLVVEGKNPWRFDTSRNLSIDMCPEDADVLVCIDLDEILVPGWRKVIEDAWVPGTNHMSYFFAWSMDGDKPRNCFWYEKIHSRHDYVWASPVHEAIVPKHGVVDHRVGVATCLVQHYPDGSKSRAQYLNLLELCVREAPGDPRVRFYLGREYTFCGRHQDAINSHKHLLSMPNSHCARERSNACLQIASCFGALKDDKQHFNWLLRAITEESGQREAWVELADYCRIKGDNVLGCWAAKKALSIPVSACDNSYLVDPDAWKHKPHDIAAITGWHAFNPNMREDAAQDAWNALGYSPWNDHLANNYRVSQDCLAKPVKHEDVAVDVIILSYSKTAKEYEMTKNAIKSLRSSSPSVGMRFIVVETNQKLSEEPFAQTDKTLFGSGVEVCYPGGPFEFNKYLKAGYDFLSKLVKDIQLFVPDHVDARYLALMNNDVTLFNPGFMAHMLEGMKFVMSASPLGLREATWGLVNRSVAVDENYDINRAVNGWFLMFDKKILNALPFEKLFPPEFTWYGGDIHYAQQLERCGYKHGMINAAQALHLQKQSHPLRTAAGFAPPSDRNAMLKALNLKGKACVEVGVECGTYSEAILAEDPKSLLLVDPWKHQDNSVYPLSDTSNVDDVEFERRLQVVKAKFDKDPRVTVCRAFSVQAAKLYVPKSLDFVYIDAVHTTVAVAEDMSVWWPLIKSGGWLCGHDYSHPDVAAAVNEFVKQNCLTLDFSTKENGPATSWGLKKPEDGSESEVSSGL
jgi:GT2 family glycosyltransferase/glycosyltransferase involved in cell wall biosynthesis